MVYQHPLAYLVALEGLALLRAWAGDLGDDESFVVERLAALRRLLSDPVLTAHPGFHAATDATDETYEQWAGHYDTDDNGLFSMDEPLIAAIVDELPQGRRVVDVGCGTGRLARLLHDRGHRVVGVDGSVAMLARAREQLPEVTFSLGSFVQIPLHDRSADLVVTGLALTHEPDLAAAYAEFARVLDRRGDLIVSDVHADLVLLGSVPRASGPQGEPRGQATAIRHSTGDHLRAALGAGFEVLSCVETPTPRRLDVPEPEGNPERAAASDATPEIGDWSLWPWTLLGFDPAATEVAWNIPALTVWHFRKQPA